MPQEHILYMRYKGQKYPLTVMVTHCFLLTAETEFSAYDDFKLTPILPNRVMHILNNLNTFITPKTEEDFHITQD